MNINFLLSNLSIQQLQAIVGNNVYLYISKMDDMVADTVESAYTIPYHCYRATTISIRDGKTYRKRLTIKVWVNAQTIEHQISVISSEEI